MWYFHVFQSVELAMALYLWQHKSWLYFNSKIAKTWQELCIPKLKQCQIISKQDGPSLESSSYLNLRLRYLGPQDLLTQRTLDSWTLGLWDLFPPPPPPPSSYLLLLWFVMVRCGMGMVWYGPIRNKFFGLFLIIVAVQITHKC